MLKEEMGATVYDIRQFKDFCMFIMEMEANEMEAIAGERFYMSRSKEAEANEFHSQIFKNTCIIKELSLHRASNEEFESVELCPVELIKDYNDELAWFNLSWLYSCIDTLEELREVVEWHIKTDKVDADYSNTLHHTFEYCPQLYKQDLELFKKAVNHCAGNRLSICNIFRYCTEVLELLPEARRANIIPYIIPYH